MALLFADGFDGYGTGLIGGLLAENGWSVTGSANGSTVTPFSVGKSLRLSNAAVSRDYPNRSTIFIGFDYRRGSAFSDEILMIRFDPNIVPGEVLNLLAIKADYLGRIQAVVCDGAYNSTTGQTFTSNEAVLLEGSFDHIDVKYSPHGDTGEIEVRVNGVTVISVTGATRGLHRPNLSNNIRFRQQSSEAGYVPPTETPYYDNLYITDTTGPAPLNTFLSDYTIIPTPLTGDEFTDWTPSATGTHYTLVNEATPDGDTTYVESNTAGNRDIFSISSIPSDIVSVAASVVKVRAKKSAVGLGKFRFVSKNGVPETVTSPVAVTADYKFYTSIFPEKPGGGAWTVAEINAQDFGVEAAA